MDPLLRKSGCELARLIREGECSALQVVECHIERIEQVNPRLNAVVRERFDAARQEALEADALGEMAPAADLPPFHGVPCTIKESCALSGMPNSSGLVSRAGTVAREDAPPVARLRAAGAIPLGVTNTSEVTSWPAASNRVYGRTGNAYDPDYQSGGSSGGEGAIIGAGGSPFGLGTDIGGSIRIPAFANGVFGHKPSAGLVPGTGQYPTYSGPLQRFNTTGPLARRAEDLMPLLRILAGPDGVDAGCTGLELGDPTGVKLESIRVIVAEGDARRPIDVELRVALHDAGYALARRGARVEMQDLPRLRRAAEIYGGLMLEAGGMPLETALGDGEPIHMGREAVRALVGASPHTLPVLLLGLFQRLGRLAKRRFARYAEMGRELQMELRELLGDDGVLLFPPARSTPPRHGRDLAALRTFVLTGLFNVLEMPVTQVPLGIGSRGLPLGVQVAGVHGNDHLPIAIAMELERLFGGWTPPALFADRQTPSA
jgi:fatty acid amide hydrolase 2